MSGLVPFDTSHKRASEADQHLVQERSQRICTEKSQGITAMALIQGYRDEDEMSDEVQEKAKDSDEDSDEEGGVSYSEFRKELTKTDLTPHHDVVGNAKAGDEGRE